MAGQIKFLIEGATTTVDGAQMSTQHVARTFHAIIRGTGSVSATVIIEVSNDSQTTPADALWFELGNIGLSGTTNDNGGFGSVVPWLLIRARITAISGTNATVDVIMGV